MPRCRAARMLRQELRTRDEQIHYLEERLHKDEQQLRELEEQIRYLGNSLKEKLQSRRPKSIGWASGFDGETNRLDK